MKSLILALALSLSTSAFARQYIQCSTRGDSTDVAVVNLSTPQGGTVFMSSGMQNPEDERILLDIEFDKIEGQFHNFKIVSDAGEGRVLVSSDAIGKKSDYLIVDVRFMGYSMEYSCFSRIYND